MNRYVCIHGHFYQPPRENPWLEEIETQDSAFPYHDWNRRITSECYSPNAASRILDGQRKIIDIVNNYSKISFNFGATLLSWMEKNEPGVYAAVLEADKAGMKNFSGHGPAIAQVYNHMILPLANTADKRTQVIWGIRDFIKRFNREPEGMWLAETAVDTGTLEVLAENGIKFTILAPNQAKEIRKIGDESWTDVSGSRIDPRRPYLCVLPSGKKISLFFYDGPISNDIGFGSLLKNGEAFAARLMSVFSEGDNGPELSHIATDGETYGHHQMHGDMALAFCIHDIEVNKRANITVYGEYLEKFPPQYEAGIFDNSSWSCAHGVERWKSACGCSSGMNNGWKQDWREPLRNALDMLRDRTAEIYSGKASAFLTDPWKARDEYIEVVLNREPENIDRFFRKNSARELTPAERNTAIKLLEVQRNAMLMYTSCGWFFDEISGLETTQILRYAARVIQLIYSLSGIDMENDFLGMLEKAPTNIPKLKNGAEIYRLFVKPSSVDLLSAGVHYAVSSIFEEYPEKTDIYCYTVENEVYDKITAGKQKLVIGKAKIRSKITLDEGSMTFVVLHMGDHNLFAGVREFVGVEAFEKIQSAMKEAFGKSDVQEVIRLLDENFESHNYSLWNLFKDEQQKVLNEIFNSIYREIGSSYRLIYENNYQVMQVMKDKNIKLPKAFLSAVEFVLNLDMKNLMEDRTPQPEDLRRIVSEAGKWGVELDKNTVKYIVSEELADVFEMLMEKYDDITLFEKIKDTLAALEESGLELNLWKAQNIYFKYGSRYYPFFNEKASAGDEAAGKWVDIFMETGRLLKVGVV